MRYGIATLLGEYPDGYEFTEANTPLHLTYIDALEIDLEPQKFVYKLRQHLSKQPPFDLLPVADTLFGPNKDIPVTVIELSPELKAFHERLIHFLESEGAVFVNPHFLNEHYGPHVSIYGLRRIKIGRPITINSVSVGNKRADTGNPPNRIIATIPLLG